MATQSAAPPNPSDDKPQNPAASEVTQPTIQDQHESKAEDPPQNVSNSQPAGNQDAAPAGVISTNSRPSRFPWFRFRWYHAVVAVVFIVLSVAGAVVLSLKWQDALVIYAVVPRWKSWIRKVVFGEEKEPAKKMDSKPSLEQGAAAAEKSAATAAAAAAEKAAAAAATAAAAAADVARASKEMLMSKVGEEKIFKELMNLIAVQVQEMKSMNNSIRNLEGGVVDGNGGNSGLIKQLSELGVADVYSVSSG